LRARHALYAAQECLHGLRQHAAEVAVVAPLAGPACRNAAHAAAHNSTGSIRQRPASDQHRKLHRIEGVWRKTMASLLLVWLHSH
jgi:hypothetical protein